MSETVGATVASVGSVSSDRLQCQKCNSSYSRPEHLKRHLRSHTKEKPFVCKRCGKKFTRSDSLHRHSQLHVSPPPNEENIAFLLQPQDTPDLANTFLEVSPTSGSQSLGLRDTTNLVDEPHRSMSTMHINLANDSNHGPEIPYPTGAEHGSHLQATNPLGDPQGLDYMDLNWLPLMSSIPDYTLDLQHTWSSLPDFARLPQDGSMMFRENSIGFPVHDVLRTPRHLSLASPSAGTHVSGVSDNSGPPDLSPAAEEQTPSGEFYADGGATRLPRGKKRKRRAVDTAASKNGTIHGAAADPSYGFGPEETIVENSNHDMLISPQIYTTILNEFIDTCCSERSLFPPYETGVFPSRIQLDRYMRLAEEFLASCPLVHNSLLAAESQASSLLCLALASIGSHYEETGPDIKNILSLNEFLRRAIVRCEKWKSSVPELELVQAKLLYCIGAYYSGDRRQVRHKEGIMGDLIEFCRITSASFEQDIPPPAAFHDWITRETSIRVVYYIWLVDCMLSYQTNRKPCLDLSSTHMPLPCLDVLWEAPSADSWSSKIELASPNPSLYAAVETLYLEKRVPQTIGELSRILLIHGLFHHTWLVSKQYTSTLNTWQPHCKSSVQDESQPPTSTRTWPPSIPAFARWRNAACDCLDALHWHANALIGLASGREHPTVFFLHLARIVLLAPIDSIRTLALTYAGVAVYSQAKLDEAREEIFRWAREDQYKARLAMIHAGVLLYHIRRHSTDAFYEPWGVYLSTLTLWAYGTVWAQSTNVNAAATLATLPDGDDTVLPAFIHIDRPCDDELVQLYILHGSNITAHLQGVGDFCTPEGSRKVLKEGCKLLKELRNWDFGSECLSRLTLLWQSLEA